MKLETRFNGIVEYKEDQVIFFKKGLPGFENLKEFILFPLEGNEIFSILHSTEDMNIGIPVMSPFSACKEYEFKLSDEIREELNVKSPEDVLVLTTVTINSNYKNITTNLKAPLVINIKEKIGEQIILEKEDYKIKYPIFQEENRC